MCGRFVLRNVEAAGTRFRFGVIEDLDSEPLTPWRARHNIAPSQQVVTVVVAAGGERVLRQLRWGFAPGWFTPTAKRPPPINARAETLLEKPLWRGALLHGRCIIPADGFYEWMTVPHQKAKQPMHIRLKSGELFGFAGLWTETRDGAGSCAIVTCAANELMTPIHHRMPCILQPYDEAPWLDPSLTEPAAVLSLLRAYPAELLEAYPVAPLVSSVRNDSPQLAMPLGTTDIAR